MYKLALLSSITLAAQAALAGSVPIIGSTPPPKAAAIDYDRTDLSAPHAALLAKFPLAILNYTRSFTAHGSQAGSQYQNTRAFLDSIRSSNPDIDIVQYTNVMEMYPTQSGTDDYPIEQQIDANNWWAYDNPSHVKAAWDFKDQNTYLTNLTIPAYREAKAQFDWDYYLTSLPEINGVFIDNVWDKTFPLDTKPSVTADYLLTGSDPAVGNATVDAATRAGMAGYADAQVARGAKLVVVNAVDNFVHAANDLSMPEYKGKFDGGLLEGMMGKPYSANWNESTFTSADYQNKMIAPYLRLKGNLKGKQYAIFQIYDDPSWGDKYYRLMRWGLASAMMGDGYFATMLPNGATGWFDELEVLVGTPTEAVQSAPRTAGGLWYRKYQFGMALVNPTSSPLTLDLTGQGYYRIDASRHGNQDGKTNNGQLQTVVTVPQHDGLLLLTYKG